MRIRVKRIAGLLDTTQNLHRCTYTRTFRKLFHSLFYTTNLSFQRRFPAIVKRAARKAWLAHQFSLLHSAQFVM